MKLIMLTIISKLTLLHDIFSRLLLLFPIFFVHNLSKYNTINKIFYNLALDQVNGDCIEFGIFTGASLKHSIRSNKKHFKNSKSIFLDFIHLRVFQMMIILTLIKKILKIVTRMQKK